MTYLTLIVVVPVMVAGMVSPCSLMVYEALDFVVDFTIMPVCGSMEAVPL